MLKLLVTLTCLGAVMAAAGPLKPKAKKNSFLFEMQSEVLGMINDYFPSGVMGSQVAMGVNMAQTDFCKIQIPAQQSHNSIFFGATCKAAFVELYEADEDQCGGLFCDAVRMFKNEAYGIMSEFVLATSDDEAFGILKEAIVKPVMMNMCKCAMPLMDAWMGCVDTIGDAQVFDLLQISGAFDVSADYLSGTTFKAFWIEFIAEKVNWENIRVMFERVVSNMCEDDTQHGGKCYDFYYGTFTHLYQWYLRSRDMNPSPCKGKKCMGNPAGDYEQYCSSFNLGQFMDSDYDVSFSDLKSALISKFCVEECSGLYQGVLLGCCTATMIQDQELSQSVVDVSADFANLYKEMYPEETDNVDAGFTMYLNYAKEALGMLRDPTCDNGVQYDVTPCAEYDASSSGSRTNDACAELSGKAAKKCKKAAAEGSSGGSGDCEGLSGKKLKKCEKTAAGGSGDCEGLSGKKLKKCEKTAAGGSGDCEGLSGKKLKKCEKKAKGKKGKNAEA